MRWAMSEPTPGWEIMKAWGYRGDPEEFSEWLAKRRADHMDALGFRSPEEYDAYLRGRSDGVDEAEQRHRRAIRFGAFTLGVTSWIRFVLLAAAALIVGLLLLWGYFTLMQLTEPYGWASLLLLPIGAVLFLMWDERSKRAR